MQDQEEYESLLNTPAHQDDGDESGEHFNEKATYQSFPDVEANARAQADQDETGPDEIRESGDEVSEYVIPSNQVSSIYEEEGIRKRNLKKVGKVLVGGAEVVEEGIEGLSISYSQYLIVVDPAPKLQKNYNYAFMAAGTLLGVSVELLHLLKVISDKKHHQYRLAKEAVAGAAVAAIYAERIAERLIVKFSSEEEPSPLTLILIGTSVFALLATSKSLIEIFKRSAFFKSKPGKIIEYLAGGTYNLLMGAGICDYTFEICEGFGKPVSLPIQISVTAAVAVTNLLADLPIAKYRETHQKNYLYKLAQFVRAGIFGIEEALILVIFYFDLTLNIQDSEKMTNTQFAFGIVVPVILSGVIMLSKLINDKKEEHFEEEHNTEERQPSINGDRPSTSYFSLKSISKPWHKLTNPEEPNEDRQLREIIARNTERKPSSRSYLPSLNWLRDCFKHEDNSPEETITENAEGSEGRNYFNYV